MADGPRITSNKCQVAQRIVRTDTDIECSEYIAAIDFGTVNCSVAYAAPGEMGEHGPVLLPFDTFFRVPTAILFNTDGIVEAFGADAREIYGNTVRIGNQLEYTFFEQLKMDMQHDQSVNRERKVKASNDKEYYLVEVIAHILKYLKDELIRVLQASGLPVTATYFDWVITVPAIWRAKGKQMMREAGYKAGLCSRERCPALKEAHTHTPERIEEEKPEKLSLALEPECTAIFCEYKSKMQSSCNSESNESTNENSDNYLVVDIGGGTVDISAHRLVRDPEPHIQVILPPAGNDCGGTQINKEFMRYLEELVDDSGFRRFVLTSDQVVNSKHRFILSAIMNQKFEDIKKLFGKRVKFMGSVHLFPEFVETYENNIKRGLEKSDSIIQLVGLNLRVSRELMTSLFEKTANGIIACIDEVIEKVGSIRLIYLAGGFGGSHYIKKLVTERLKEKDIKCIVPVDHPYAVARGAALFKMNPSVIECRKVDATYGIQANTRFQHGLHDPKYMWTDDDNKLQCKNIFCTVVEKGDIVGKGEVFSMTFNPASHNQKNVLIEFYSSQDTDVFYVTGEWGIGKCEPRHTVTKIGQITVDMPVPDGDKKRGVDVIFSFSHTEIKVRALDQTSNTEVKTVLDFLNTQTV